MLRKPSSILADVHVQYPREYAYHVFWSLQQSDHHTRFFDTSFVNPADASRVEESVRNLINDTIACLGAENCIALAPLFVRAQEDALIQLSSQLVLVMYREGPVIPVLLLRHTPFPDCIGSSPHQEKELQVPAATVHITTSSSSPPFTQQKIVTNDSGTLVLQPPVQQGMTTNKSGTPVLQPPVHHENVPQLQKPFRTDDESKQAIDLSAHPDPNDHKPLILSKEDELRYVQMMTKTPIAAVCNLRNSTMPDSLTREEQLQRCQQMKQSIESLYHQRMQHEQVLCNPHIRPTTQRVLKESLARKCDYIQQQLGHIASERAKLIEQQQLNEVTRRVLLSGSDMDLSWQKDIDSDSDHLQACIELLEAANPNMSV